MQIQHFFDPATWTLTYLVHDGRDAVVIDPVLDFDPARVSVSTTSLDRVSAVVAEHDLRLRWVLETHAHADHLSGSQVLKERFGAGVAVHEAITTVQQAFAGVFDADFPTDGSQFDRLLKDGEVLSVGTLEVRVLHTPGHTPACASFLVGDALFTGDALFMPDFGTGRCDFPAGSAEDLYESITGKLYALPPETRVFVGHDYQPGGRELAFETTIGASMEANRQLPAGRSREDFVRWRSDRDATLPPPKLLFQAVQVNADAGRLPEPAANGRRYLKLPMGLFD